MKQKAYIRGRDKDGRALLIMHPRTRADTVEEDFIMAMVYLMERAIAFTEYDSQGSKEKISAVFDFASFNSSLAPSTEAIKRVVGILQTSYSERLQKLVIVDPPFWMRTVRVLPSIELFTSIVSTNAFLYVSIVSTDEGVGDPQALPASCDESKDRHGIGQEVKDLYYWRRHRREGSHAVSATDGASLRRGRCRHFYQKRAVPGRLRSVLRRLGSGSVEADGR